MKNSRNGGKEENIMQRRKYISYFCALAILITAGGYATSVFAAPKFIAALNSSQMVPHNSSTGRAYCRIKSYDWFSVNLECSYWGLSSDLTTADVLIGNAGQMGSEGCISKQFNGTPGTIGAFTLACGPVWDVPTRLLRKNLHVVIKSVNYPNGELRGQMKIVAMDNDLDGDGQSDPTIYRANENSAYGRHSMDADTQKFECAAWTSNPFPPFFADFDGDGLADFAYTYIHNIFSSGQFVTIYTRSIDGIIKEIPWGDYWLNDKRVYADFDGDAAMDIAVFRQNTGVWYILQSSDQKPRYEWWGKANDTPCAADYDGDGRTDLCVARREDSYWAWHIRYSSNGTYNKFFWGLSTDTLYPDTPADVDGDGKTDLLVGRSFLNGQLLREFYVRRSSDGTMYYIQWGLWSDRVRIGDFDGDGRTDFASIRQINAQFAWFLSSGGDMFYWGKTGDQ